MLDPETRGLIRLESQKAARKRVAEKARPAELPTLTRVAEPTMAREHLPEQKTNVSAAPKVQKEKKLARPGFLRPAGPRTLGQATYFLDLLSALVPQRIAHEEIGDAIEVINKMITAGRPKWFVYLKVGTTFFWVGIHTLLLCGERVAGIVKIALGKGDKD